MRLTTDAWFSLNETPSTNTLLLEGNYPAGTMVTAAHQSGGRGRSGRAWADPSGGSFLFSLLTEYSPIPANPGFLPLLAGLCVLEAAESALLAMHPTLANETRLSIKWPNDVLLTRREGTGKLAGVLLESRVSGDCMRVVTGVGLNWSAVPTTVENALFPPVALFHQAEPVPEAGPEGRPGRGTGDHVSSPEGFLPWLVHALNAREYGAGGPAHATALDAEVRDALWRRFYLAGRHVRTVAGEGLVAGLDRDGALLIEGEGRSFRWDRTDEDLEIL